MEVRELVKELLREVVQEERASNLKLAGYDHMDTTLKLVLNCFDDTPKSKIEGYLIARAQRKMSNTTFRAGVQRLLDLGKLKALNNPVNRRHQLIVKA